MNILGALTAGYSMDTILSMLSSRYPAIGQQLDTARAAGYDTQRMLKYLSQLSLNDMDKLEKGKGVQVSDNPLIAAQEETSKGGPHAGPIKAGLKAAAGLGAAAGGTYLAAKLAQRAVPAISGMLAGKGTPATAPVAPPIPSPTAAAAPIASEKHIGLIKQLGDSIERTIENQRGAHSPEDLAKIVDFVLSPGQKKWIKEQTDAPLEQIVSDYLQATPKTEPKAEETVVPNVSEQQKPIAKAPEVEAAAAPSIAKKPEELPKVEEEPILIPQEKKEEKQPTAPPQEKPASGKDIGSIVSVDGLPGKIEDIRQDIAKVNVDGKIRHLKLKDIEEEPEDIKEAVIRLLKIPERDRSAVTAYFGYDPESKSLAVQYHNGVLYTYDDVDEEKIHKLANKLGIPITTGKNIFGEWEEGKQDSLGAALIAEIIRAPEYSKQNKNKTWRKYDTGYDYWEKLRQKPKRKPKKP